MTANPRITAAYLLRTSSTWQSEPDAHCRDCDWQRDDGRAGNWLAIRAAARRHCRRTGHTVTVSVRNVYEYDLTPDDRG